MKKNRTEKVRFLLAMELPGGSNRRPSDYEYETECLMSLTGYLYKILKTAFELFRAGFAL